MAVGRGRTNVTSHGVQPAGTGELQLQSAYLLAAFHADLVA